jgi:hypothetical protein
MVDLSRLADKAAEEGDSVLDYLKIVRSALLRNSQQSARLATAVASHSWPLR